MLSVVDPGQLITHRLYRQHTVKLHSAWVKDLSKLGRDLHKTIIVDDKPSTFQLQPQNGVCIPGWTGDPADQVLPVLLSYLTRAAAAEDVRHFLKTTPFSAKLARQS